ncbi:unnamed protein product [Moneuplotes crassus]|uniref:Uncharacterized protein n=1 Tax=Euplotes crassus TaxID=5936 RepID=A0AAD1Y4G4_EUPCR|nr:unnamed protein product [Moneuplotes crassus]
MSVPCFHIKCENLSVMYCCDHKAPLCMNCKQDQHYKCNHEHMIPAEVLEVQINKIIDLMATTKKLFYNFSFEDDYAEAAIKIKNITISINEIEARVNKAIMDKDFLSFPKHQQDIIDLRQRIDDDENIKLAMSQIFQQLVKKKKIDKGFNLTRKIEAEKANQTDESDTKPDIEETKNEVTVDIIDPDSTSELENLRKKHFQTKGVIHCDSDITLDFQNEKCIDFIHDSIKNNVKMIEVDQFRFTNLPSKSELLSSYLDKCIPKRLCNSVELNCHEDSSSVEIIEYKSSLEKLMISEIPELTIHKFILSKDDLYWLSDLCSDDQTIRILHCFVQTDTQKDPISPQKTAPQLRVITLDIKNDSKFEDVANILITGLPT